MPFARPGSSSPAVSLAHSLPASSSSNHGCSSSLIPSAASSAGGAGGKLATPWDSHSLELQLQEMRDAASLSSASVSSTSMSSPSATTAGTSHHEQPHYTHSPVSPKSQSAHVPQAPPMATQSSETSSNSSAVSLSSSPGAAPPIARISSHRAMKQRLFQMSDDEGEETLHVQAGDVQDQDKLNSQHHQASHHQHARAERNDPIRHSISAMSGVTVIGRGSFNKNRDSQGSIQSIGSPRSTALEGRGSMDSAHEAPHHSQPSPSMPVSPDPAADNARHQQTGSIDMPSALQLLQMYPTSSSPPRFFDDRPVLPPRSSSLISPPVEQQPRSNPLSRTSSASFDPLSPSPRSQAFPALSEEAAPASTAPPNGGLTRRHSRSSAAGDFLMSPIMGNFQPGQQNGNDAPSRALAASPPLSEPGLSSPFFARQTSQSMPSTSTYPYEGSALSTASSSRGLSTLAQDDSPDSRGSRATSRSVSTNDLARVIRSFSQHQRQKPSSRRRSTHGAGPPQEDVEDMTTVVDGEPENALRRSGRSSRNSSQTNLRDLIRQKRRQASAPFFKDIMANISIPASPTHSGTHSPVASQPEQIEPWDHTSQRRARSRRGTGAAGPGLHLSFTSNGFQEARQRAMRGMGDVVMTPSVEEWKQLGLHASDDKSGSESSGSDSDSDSSESSNAVVDETDENTEANGRHASRPGSIIMQPENILRPRMGSITSFNQYYGSLPPSASESPAAQSPGAHGGPGTGLSGSSSRTMNKKSPKKRGYRDVGDEYDPTDDDSLSAIGDVTDSEVEAVPSSNRNSMPTLSRQSLSLPSGSPFPGPIEQQANTFQETATPPNGIEDSATAEKRRIGTELAAILSSPAPPFSPSRPSSPIPLGANGPIDPRAYSAVTALRNINSFVVQGEAGKGAYGLVRRVRERGPDGRATGPVLMLKYIVKQRILADAYKRHKVLGVIPMEIHVLDFIRRMHRGSHKAARDPVGIIKRMHGIGATEPPVAADQAAGMSSYGHPNLCQMLDFFEDTENYYLVMSCFGNGQDLFDYVDAAPTGLSITESRSFLQQIVDAVAFLHSHGIVHRDIKDENIILDGKGGVQLIDFGSAAYIKEGKPYFDTFSGTLDFASPEVLRGERYGGKETDVWALGVLAYVIICGECPFWSSEESLTGLVSDCRSDIALQAKVESPESLAELESLDNISPRDASDFVHQCLDVHARDRPPAVELRQHRFIAGKSGWIGKRGWEHFISNDSEASDADSS